MSQRPPAFRPSPRAKSTFSIALTAALALSAHACSKEEVKPDMTPKLGVLELSSSHRTADPEPSGAARMEITPSELLLDGEQVIPLENAKLPAAERTGYVIPKLKQKLSGKKSLALGVYAAVPYATLARVLYTALDSGASELSFRVRKPNATNQTGWLTLKKNRFVKSAENSEFSESELVPWDSFAKVWEESLMGCQAYTKGDCGYRPMAKAEGGQLDLMLRVRGSGYALRFRQAGVTAVADAGTDAGSKVAKGKDKKKKKKAEMLDGVKAAPDAPEEVPPEPATEHVFSLRTDAATMEPSPISGITKPVCGSVTCPVVLDVEGISMATQVIALLGAAFPDGTPAPSVAWVLPPENK